MSEDKRSVRAYLSDFATESVLVSKVSIGSLNSYLQVVYYTYFVILLIPTIVPYEILSELAYRPLLSFFGSRSIVDYEYLIRMGYSHFASAYVGGLCLQFGATIVVILISSGMYAASSDSIFVTDKSYIYVVSTASAVTIGLAGIYFLTSLDDFNKSGELVSWFQDDPNTERNFTPMPTNSIVFLVTAACFYSVFLLGTSIARTIFIFSSGKKMKFHEIEQREML